MDINIEYIGGNCPVQAEGIIDGYPFYFRARGNTWRLEVCLDKSQPVNCLVWWEAECGVWEHEENYGERFEAGWMSKEEACQFINKAAILFCKSQIKKRSE